MSTSHLIHDNERQSQMSLDKTYVKAKYNSRLQVSL